MTSSESDPSRDLAELQRQLEQERRHAEQWRRVAEERRLVLEKLRRNPMVDRGLAVRHRLRRYEPTVTRARQEAARLRGVVSRWKARAHVVQSQVTARARRKQLEQEVGRLGEPNVDPRRVALVVLTRDGHDRLATLLPWLRRLPGDRELVVVDNGSADATRRWLRTHDEIHVVRLDEHQSYSAANNAGVAATDAEVVCLLNDDVVPLDTTWLDRMLSHLTGDIGLVGAQLVYPQRGLLGSNRADLTVQHRGIRFETRRSRVPLARNVSGCAPDPTFPAADVAAVTGACMVVDRRIWDELGGLDEQYAFGAEDVDFGWRARQRGWRILVEPSAVLYHYEGATRLGATAAKERLERQEANWRTFEDRHGAAVTRAVLQDRLAARGELCDRPLTVAITVTRDDPDAGYGDWYTADGLRGAMQRLGWEVRFIQRHGDDWYRVGGDVDVLVSLLDTFDVRRVARPGLVTLAWVRNWADRWVSRPWWRDYDVILASSQVIADRVRRRSGRSATVFPLATDPERFRARPRERHGIVVAMNHWGTDDRLAPVLSSLHDVEVYGRGWERVSGVAEHWHGHAAQDELAQIYGRASVVVDRAGVHTRDDASINARVMDALAAGADVVTDQVAGAAELFGDDLPTYSSAEELPELLGSLQAPDTVAALGRCREVVLTQHTWDVRARSLRSLLMDHSQRQTWLVQTAAPRKAAEGWGDWHFGQDLAAALRRAGHPAWVAPVEDWDDPAASTFEVAVHLRGRGVAPTRAGRTDLIWCISHPNELEPEHLEGVDLVMVASQRLAADLAGRTTTPVGVLLQATDQWRFLRRPDPMSSSDVLFVGNSRFSERPIVRDALEAELPITVIGRDWEGRIPPQIVRLRQVANEDLARWYSTAKVVLNDHWEDMRRWGIVSNRVFDALACEATVVSDDLMELHDLFADVVATYDDRDDLARVVGRLLSDDDERLKRGRRGRDLVLEGHTFDHRAADLLAAVDRL